MSKKQEGKTSSNGIFNTWTGITLIIFSMIWAGLIIVITLQSKNCELGNCIHHFYPNELGDFLAGAFAPLAFIWLAGAVFIQSQELKAQRGELSLTRMEMEKSREVMIEQANHSKASTKFIGQQTKLLKSENEQRKIKEADDQLSELTETLEKILNNYTEVSYIFVIEGAEFRDNQRSVTRHNWSKEKKINAFAIWGNQFTKMVQDKSLKKERYFEIHFSQDFGQAISSILHTLLSCQRLRKDLSPNGEASYSFVNIDLAVDTAELFERGHKNYLSRQEALT